MIDVRRWTVALLTLTLVACSARGSPGPGGPAALESVLDRASSELWFVRATTPDSIYAGTVRTPAMGRVWIGEAYVPIADITVLERRESRGTGAWPGAAMGAVAIGAGAWVAGGAGDNPPGQNGRQLLAATGFVLGGVIGYLVGREVVPGEERWVDAWAARLE